ncbi:MAG: class I SAM-dependent methyltransferase [Promethearchaeota archaeon]
MTILIKRINAWTKLFKLGFFVKFAKQLSEFCHDHLILGLKDDFLNYLRQAHTFREIKRKFDVLDDKYLHLLLDTLLSDNTIDKTPQGFILNKSIDDIKPIAPEILNEVFCDFLKRMANSVFNRLYGQFFDSSSGSNLFAFDDALTQKLYEYIRLAAISYVPEVLECHGKILDLGCGSGTETADLWTQIMKKCNFKPLDNFKLIGVDNNEEFIDIANNEFYYHVKNYYNLTEEAFTNLKPYHPEFKKGTSTKIPYPENYFDYIYSSQILHWTDLNSSLTEIYRCLKPGGIYFGTNMLFPRANSYQNLMINTIKGAGGFFTKEEMKESAIKVGFSKIKFCTPVTIFKFKK